MAAWYVSSAGWTAVAAWSTLGVRSVGDFCRQLAAPSVGNERVWRCTTAGISGAAEPSWTLTKGSTTNDGTAVWTEVTGSSTYNSASSYAAPHARIANAISWGGAGDDYYFPASHAETQAATLTLAFKGGTTPTDRAFCVDASGIPTTGASLTTTGAFGITLTGSYYIEGVAFNVGTGSSTASFLFSSTGAGFANRLKNCAINLVTTASGSRITISNVQYSKLLAEDCTVSFGAVGQSIKGGVGYEAEFRNTAAGAFVTGATIPTTLFTTFTNGNLVLDGLDLNALGSGKTIFETSANPVRPKLINCKLNASVTISGAVTGTEIVEVTGSGSASNVSQNQRLTSGGTLTTETTIIRTAGASDGTTAYSWKIVTTANALRINPFETHEILIWNDAIGSPLTLTIHTVTDNVTLTDAGAWVEVAYLYDSATPLVKIASDANATVLTAPANQTSDSGEAWTTTGLGTPVKQALAATFTPQMKGYIRVRIKVARPSTTVYVCPPVPADLA